MMMESKKPLGGGFKYVLFHPYLGKMIYFDSYFSKLVEA